MSKTKIKVSKETAKAQFYIGLVFVVLGIFLSIKAFTYTPFSIFSPFENLFSQSNGFPKEVTNMMPKVASNPLAVLGQQSGMSGFFNIWKVFPVFFTLVAVFMTYRGYKGGFKNDGMTYYEMETTHDMDTRQGMNPSGNLLYQEVTDTVASSNGSFDEKLRKVEQLYSEGLLSADEYKRKREEIINQTW